MRITPSLPDDLMRAVKTRAVEEGRTPQDTFAELLRRGLADEPRPSRRARGHRVKLPLVQCAHTARRSREMTPERVAQVLLAEEARLRRLRTSCS